MEIPRTTAPTAYSSAPLPDVKNISLLWFAGAAGVLLLAPGYGKLLALPLMYIGAFNSGGGGL